MLRSRQIALALGGGNREGLLGVTFIILVAAVLYSLLGLPQTVSYGNDRMADLAGQDPATA